MPYADRNRQRDYLRNYRSKNPDVRNRLSYNRARREKLRAFVNAEKPRPCADCGHTFPAVCMDFDHIRGIKEANINTAIAQNWAISRVATEMEKCDVVCACCHRLRTQGRSR